MTDGDTASGPLREARAAREAGKAWKARDILVAHVESLQDTEALSELGEVLFGMGDLPRAGAVWFVAGAKGPDVDTSVAAWREQLDDDFAAMWASLPASARSRPRPPRVEALRERALRTQAASVAEVASDDQAAGVVEEDEGGFDAAWLVAWVLAVAFVVFAVIGVVTTLEWVMPG